MLKSKFGINSNRIIITGQMKYKKHKRQQQ